jgi:cytochrome c peroxidase
MGIPRYHDYFSKAFPGQGDPVTLANVQKSIAVFEATLITPNAPFDRFVDGKADALSAKQQDGFRCSCEGLLELPQWHQCRRRHVRAVWRRRETRRRIAAAR